MEIPISPDLLEVREAEVEALRRVFCDASKRIRLAEALIFEVCRVCESRACETCALVKIRDILQGEAIKGD